MPPRQFPLVRIAALASLVAAGASPVSAQSVSEERPVAAFTEIRASRGVDVELTQGARESLRIEAKGIELAEVISRVENGALILSTSKERWGQRDIVAHVGFVQLSSIAASGGSDIEGRNRLRFEDLTIEASGGSDVELDLEANNLELRASGGSDLDLRGTARVVSISASGGSDASAKLLRAERVEARVSGGSDAELHATTAIEIHASGGSDVEIFGNPGERRVDNDRSSDVTWR